MRIINCSRCNLIDIDLHTPSALLYIHLFGMYDKKEGNNG